MSTITWTVTDLTDARPICPRSSALEFQDHAGNWHYFELLKTTDRIIFGGHCNVGFIESGYIEREGETLEETLCELLADLETFYNDGRDYVSRIVCNDRM